MIRDTEQLLEMLPAERAILEVAFSNRKVTLAQASCQAPWRCLFFDDEQFEGKVRKHYFVELEEAELYINNHSFNLADPEFFNKLTAWKSNGE